MPESTAGPGPVRRGHGGQRAGRRPGDCCPPGARAEERPVTDNTPVSKVEGIKVTSDYLRGTIAEELAGDVPVFSSDSYERHCCIG